MDRIGTTFRDMFKKSENIGSLSTRMFRMFFAFTLLATLLFTLIAVYYQTEKAREDMKEKGHTLSALLAQSSRIGVFVENREQLMDPVKGIMEHNEVLLVTIHTADGRELLRVARPGYSLPGESAANQAASLAMKISERSGDGFIEFTDLVTIGGASGSEEALYFGPADQASPKKNIGVVRLIFDTNSLYSSSVTIIFRYLLIACGLLVCGAILIFYVLDRSLRPLKELTSEVRMFGQGLETEKVEIRTKDEIGRLAAAFNEMAENLRKRDQEAKELELRLRHAEKMEAVGTLARGIAHDFNNILTSIEGSLFALKKYVHAVSAKDNYIIHMGNAVARAKVLIDGLLLFSRGQHPRYLPVDLNALIGGLEPEISAITGDEVTNKFISGGAPVMILADPMQIGQLIMNLVVNAKDAMPHGGILEIRTSVVTADGKPVREAIQRECEHCALISVRDSGEGMQDDVKERIFEPFFTTKDVGKGTGLGLSIVYGIVREHKGDIEVYSEKDRGSEFRVYLPLCAGD
jgi:signal transduction histidine kinase